MDFLFLAVYPQHQDTHHLICRGNLNAAVIPVAGMFSRQHQSGTAAFGWPEIYLPEMAKQSDDVLNEISAAIAGDPDVIVINESPAWSNYPRDIQQNILAMVHSGKTLIAANWNAEQLQTLNLSGTPKTTVLRNGEIQSAEYCVGNGRIIDYRVQCDIRYGYLLGDADSESVFEEHCAFFLDIFSISHNVPVPKPAIPEFTLTAGIPGQKLPIRLQMPAGSYRGGWRWFDVWNRLLLRTSGELKPEMELELPENSLSVWNRLELTVDGLPGILEIEIILPQFANRPDFAFLHWDLSKPSWKHHLYLCALRDRALADGLCNCGRGAETALMAARANLRTVAYTAWFHKIGLDNCLFNPEWRKKMATQARDTALAQRDFAPLGYTLGDECYIDAFTENGRFTRRVEIWKMFQDFLQKTYRDLAQLNAQWETAYQNWGEIIFENERDMFQSFENPSAWADFRAFVSREFIGALRELRDILKAEDPGALVGWDGCEQFSAYDGIDWYEMTRGMDITVVYANAAMGLGNGPTNVMFNSAAVNSFSRNAQLSGAFMNSVNYGCGKEFAPWALLLNGNKSMWQWHATAPDHECGSLAWNLEATPTMRGLAKTQSEFRSGAAALLTRAEKQFSPVALHYSAANFYASTIESGVGNHINNMGMSKCEFWQAEYLIGRTIKANDALTEMFGQNKPNGHYSASFKNFWLLCRDMGLRPSVAARQEIEAGALLERGLKILILPFVVALSESEAAAIHEFVRSGGTVIADYRTGVRDLHGKLREHGILDEMFGISRQNLQLNRRRAKAEVEYGFFDGGVFDYTFSENLTISNGGCVLAAYDDGTPIPNSGSAVYGTNANGGPAAIVNHFGAGKTLYLNFDIYSYEHARRVNTHSAWVELFRRIFWKLAGVREHHAPRGVSGNFIDTAEFCRLGGGGNCYYGILPDFSIRSVAEQSGFLEIPEHLHVYDIREHRYCGRGRIPVCCIPGKPVALAAVPAQIDGWTARKTNWNQYRFTARTKGVPGALALHIEVYRPDGIQHPVYSKAFYVENGILDYTLPLALNDAPGVWKIKALCVLSGNTIEAEVENQHCTANNAT